GFFEKYTWADPARAVEQFEEALRLFRALGDGWGTSHVLRRLGVFLTMLGEYDRAAILLQEAVSLAPQAQNQHALAWSLFLLGDVIWWHRKDAASARPLFEESLTLVSQTRDRHNLEYVLLALGQLAQARGDHDEAQSRYEDVVALFQESGGIDYRAFDVSCVVLVFAQLAVARGDPHQAARLFGSAHAALEKPYLRFGDGDAINRDMAVTRRQLGDSAFLAEFETGRAIPMEDALEYVVRNPAGSSLQPAG